MTNIKRHGLHALYFLFFALANGLVPLFSSNQNTYYVFGLAREGFGHLGRDWFAQSTDPYPVFSWLVQYSYRYFGLDCFYLYYYALLAVYFFSILGLFRWLFSSRAFGRAEWIFVTLLCLSHSSFFKYIEEHRGITNWFFLLHSGMAEQSILGSLVNVGFLPSTFGVFLFTAVLAFVREKPYWAAFCIGLACIFTSSYLLTGACLTAVFMAFLFYRDRNWRSPFLLGAITAALVLPYVFYLRFHFSPTSPTIYQQLHEILIQYRIRHHSVFSQWYNSRAIFQTLWIVLGIYYARRERNLFFSLLAPFALATLLTFVYLVTDSTTLGILFPWRASTFLLPMATVVVGGGLCLWLNKILPQRGLAFALGALLIGSASSGVYIQAEEFSGDADADALYRYVREHSQADDLYLIPPNLRDFRLAARASIIIDYKSHPYKDAQVVEWYRRLQALQDLAKDPTTACAKLAALRAEYSPTHIVLDKGPRKKFLFECSAWDTVFENNRFVLGKLR